MSNVHSARICSPRACSRSLPCPDTRVLRSARGRFCPFPTTTLPNRQFYTGPPAPDLSAVADLRGAPGTRAFPGVQILSISCSFRKSWQNSMSASLPEGWHPHLGEILDLPLVCTLLASVMFSRCFRFVFIS